MSVPQAFVRLLVAAVLTLPSTALPTQATVVPCPGKTSPGLTCIDLGASMSRLRDDQSTSITVNGGLRELEAALHALVIDRFAQQGLQAEVLSMNWHGKAPTENHDWEMRLRPVAMAVGRRMSMLAELRSRDGSKSQALFVMRAYTEVLVAANRITRYASPACSAFKRKRIDITTLASNLALTECKAGSAIHVIRHLETGDALHPTDIGEPYAVMEQESVRIRVSAGRVTLESGGIALASGRVGEMVAVRPSHSAQAVKGRVIEPRLVVLEEEGS